jgi:acyl carrier protein
MTELAGQILATLHRIAPDVDPAAVDPARPLVEQLDLDSIDYQNFLAALAAEHGIEIPERDVASLRSIDDLVSYIASRRVSSPRLPARRG